MTDMPPVPGKYRGIRRLAVLAGLAFTGLFLGGIYGSWTRACAGGACPSIGVLAEGYRPSQAAKIFAADGRLITDLGTERRTVLPINEIAPAVRAAFVAVEDKRFYEHAGIDWRRVFTAAATKVLSLSASRGGGASTITMQLARNVWSERLPRGWSPRRKVREARVALELESSYSKDRILELYLNQIPLGAAYGVEAAAQRFFGKSARVLNVAEAAMIAGITQSPTRLNPRVYPDRAVARRNVVINLMRNQGYLTPEDAERWKAYPVRLSSRQDFGETAPYFVEWVRQQLYSRFGDDLYEKGYRVHTTLDIDLQIAAEVSLENQLSAIERGAHGQYKHLTYAEYLEQNEEDADHTTTPYLQGALITMDVNAGHVLSMVGGRNFEHSKFNRATQARRQTGSTFKPFVYSAAIRAGKPASYIVNDEPLSLMQNDTLSWDPQNYEGDFRGPMTLREGLQRSRNLIAINLGREIGLSTVVGEAVRYGISTPIPTFPAMLIGAASAIPLEMVSAYSAFATLGVRAAPIGILRVEDGNGNIVWEPQPRRDRVMDEEHMWILNSMLQDVVNRGTAFNSVRGAGFRGIPAAGKTGTTNDGTDVWFIGYTPELVTGVWMGLDQPQKIKANSAGGVLAAPAWTAFMKEVYARRPSPRPWPSRLAELEGMGLITREVDKITGFVATQFCPEEVRYREWFIPGTQPQEDCPVHSGFRRGVSSQPPLSPVGR